MAWVEDRWSESSYPFEGFEVGPEISLRVGDERGLHTPEHEVAHEDRSFSSQVEGEVVGCMARCEECYQLAGVCLDPRPISEFLPEAVIGNASEYWRPEVTGEFPGPCRVVGVPVCYQDRLDPCIADLGDDLVEVPVRVRPRIDHDDPGPAHQVCSRTIHRERRGVRRADSTYHRWIYPDREVTPVLPSGPRRACRRSSR